MYDRTNLGEELLALLGGSSGIALLIVAVDVACSFLEEEVMRWIRKLEIDAIEGTY